jgi:hypothetical protein
MKDANRVHPAQPQVQRLDAAEAAQTILVSGPMANDGIDRRNFLSCMARAGTGLAWTEAGGVPTSIFFATTARGADGYGAHRSAGRA